MHLTHKGGLWYAHADPRELRPCNTCIPDRYPCRAHVYHATGHDTFDPCPLMSGHIGNPCVECGYEEHPDTFTVPIPLNPGVHERTDFGNRCWCLDCLIEKGYWANSHISYDEFVKRAMERGNTKP